MPPIVSLYATVFTHTYKNILLYGGHEFLHSDRKKILGNKRQFLLNLEILEAETHVTSVRVRTLRVCLVVSLHTRVWISHSTCARTASASVLIAANVMNHKLTQQK